MKPGAPSACGILAAPFGFSQICAGRVAIPVIASAVGSVVVLPASLLIQHSVSEAQKSHTRNPVVFTLLSLALQIAGALLVLRSRHRLSAIFETAAAARRAEFLRAAPDMTWSERRCTDRSLLGRRTMSDLDRVHAYAEAALGLLVPAVAATRRRARRCPAPAGDARLGRHRQRQLDHRPAAYSSLRSRKRNAAHWPEHIERPAPSPKPFTPTNSSQTISPRTLP